MFATGWCILQTGCHGIAESAPKEKKMFASCSTMFNMQSTLLHCAQSSRKMKGSQVAQFRASQFQWILNWTHFVMNKVVSIFSLNLICLQLEFLWIFFLEVHDVLRHFNTATRWLPWRWEISLLDWKRALDWFSSYFGRFERVFLQVQPQVFVGEWRHVRGWGPKHCVSLGKSIKGIV